MTFDKLVLYLHYLIILIIILAPFFIPIVLIKPFILIITAIIIQWYVLDGNCFMSYFHKNSSSNKSAVSTFFESVNLPKCFIFVDIILYMIILHAFNRINLLKEGLIFIAIIILLNKTIYGTFKLKWTEDDDNKNK